ncbi:unnamed protein product [Schistosoma turkestanicum]|nr:unnamed protein product [Schistosoma turkestanicum]
MNSSKSEKTNQPSPPLVQDSHVTLNNNNNKIIDNYNKLNNESYSSIMTLPYNLNLHWVTPMITALSMSTNSSILNLNSDLSQSITSSASSLPSLSPSYLPQLSTRLRSSSCFPFGRQSTTTDHTTIINLENSMINTSNHHDQDEKPLDLTLKTIQTEKEPIQTKLPIENCATKTCRRRKSNRTRIKTKNTSSSTIKINQSEQNNQKTETNISPSTSSNSIELLQNHWNLPIDQYSMSNNNKNNNTVDSKRQRSKIHRRPFKLFGNTVPLIISTENLLNQPIEQLNNTSSLLNQSEIIVDDLKSTKKDQDNDISTTNTSSPTLDKINSKRKSTTRIKTRRSQSASSSRLLPDNQIEQAVTVTTTTSLENLCKFDHLITATTTTQSVTSISSTPSCYSSYSELIDTTTTNTSTTTTTTTTTTSNNNDSNNINHLSNMTQTIDCNPRMRRFPEMTPSEVKDKAYWEKRVKNNEAARRSRRARKSKELTLKKYADHLEKINVKLIDEIELLKKEILHLKAEKQAAATTTSPAAAASVAAAEKSNCN